MVPLSQVVAWVIWKPGVVHPLDSRMVLEKLRHPHCILTVPLHTDVQSLQSLQQEEAIERAQCRPQISKQLYPSLHSKSYVPFARIRHIIKLRNITKSCLLYTSPSPRD